MKNIKHIFWGLMFLSLFSLQLYSQVPPTLYNPTNNSHCESLLIEFEWSEVPSAESYNLEIASDADFSNILFSVTELTETVHALTLPDWNTMYYWRASTVYPGGTVGIAEGFGFQTKLEPTTLLSPAHELSCLDTAITFIWNKADAEFYSLQISDTDTFDEMIFNKNNIIDTSYTVNIPMYSTVLYWRVAHKKATCLSDFTEPFMFTTIHEPPTLLHPVNEALGGHLFENLPFEVELVWLSSGESVEYDLQISKNMEFEEIIADETGLTDTSFKFTLPEDFDSVYYWRIKSNIEGCTSTWALPYSFKAPYNKTQLLTPLHDATCVTMKDIPFSWESVANASKYRLQISDTISFDRLISDTSNITDTSINLSVPSQLASYYWRVKAEDSNNSGLWSETSHFVTTHNAPETYHPQRDMVGLTKDVNFYWEERIPNARYDLRVYLDDASEDLVLLLDSSLIDTNYFEFSVPNDNAVYFWEVRIVIGGCKGDWSELSMFRTLIPSPVLVSPEDNSTNVSLYPIFSWEAVTDAQYYEIEISTDNSFSEIFIRDNSILSETWTMPGMMYAEKTSYFWRVRAGNDDGISLWSTVFTFTTGESTAPAPIIEYPGNGTTKIPMNPVLVWSKVDKAVEYEVTISNDLNFNDLFLVQTTADTTLEVVGLERFKDYWWRVKTIGSEGDGNTTGNYKFRTKDIVPDGTVAPASPDNNAEDMPVMITFRWHPVERAYAYHLQVSDNQDFDESSLAADHPSVKDTTRAVSGLEYDKVYYWRVAAWNEDGTADWSTVRNFKTLNPASVEDMINVSNPVSVFPNPARSHTSVQINSTTQERGVLKIVNLLGNEMIRYDNLLVNEGANIVNLDMSNLPAAVYIYVWETPSNKYTGKIVLQP